MITLKVAYFQPIMIAVDQVTPVEFSRIYTMSESLADNPDFTITNDKSQHGGNTIQIYPNTKELDVQWLITWLETLAGGYMELITQQSGETDLKYCKPVVDSIRITRQTAGDFQELHTHPYGHISGQLFISAPMGDIPEDQFGAKVVFKLPQAKDVTKFIMTDEWKYMPVPGTVILYPSFLANTVYPWQGDGTRTVMQFDIKLFPKES
jgi:Putative 2OG-Fe(II) oxygenase